MSEFKRGISQKFVDRLNAEYEARGWWRTIADDRELFIAIRKDYINIYLNGNSLLKLWLEGKELVGETHYKYLLAPESPHPYAKVFGGKPRIENAASFFMDDLSNLRDLKRSANVYYEEEKKGVHQIVMSNFNVIDVEIAFSAKNEKTSKSGASRIDFAALRHGQDGPEVVFYEAKLFANKELRASDEKIAVLNQLHRYKSFLHEKRTVLINSYRAVCGNLASLEGIKDRYKLMLDLMRNIEKLSVNEEVRLVIFGFDIDQSTGANWAVHHEKLEKALGERLLLKGDAKRFTKGISL